MAHLIGLASEQEKQELIKRGWSVDDIDSAKWSQFWGAQPEEEEADPDNQLVHVAVDSDIFQVMNGPDWEGTDRPGLDNASFARLAEFFAAQGNLLNDQLENLDESYDKADGMASVFYWAASAMKAASQKDWEALDEINTILKRDFNITEDSDKGRLELEGEDGYLR